MLSIIGVHPAGPDHIRGRVRDRVKPVNTSLKLLEGEGSRGRWGKLSWIGGQESLRGRCRGLERRGHCHRVARLDVLCHWVRRGCVLGEESRHGHGLLEAICRSWRRGDGGWGWTTEAPPSFAVEIEKDCKEDEDHRSRGDHEVDRPNMHSFQGQTVGDCIALGAGRGRFTHICVGSTAGRMSGELALGAPPSKLKR